jgi:hypothetical protein
MFQAAVYFTFMEFGTMYEKRERREQNPKISGNSQNIGIPLQKLIIIVLRDAYKPLETGIRVGE